MAHIHLGDVYSLHTFHLKDVFFPCQKLNRHLENVLKMFMMWSI